MNDNVAYQETALFLPQPDALLVPTMIYFIIKFLFFFFYNFLRIAFIKISLCLYILINFEEGSVSFLTSDNGTVLMTVPKCFACGK